MTNLMLWITAFNRCRTSLLLLKLDAFLKVRAVSFKVDSTILGDLQCSTCSAGALPTSTFSTINFIGAEVPFSNKVGPSRVVWHNYGLVGCVEAFSHLLKCFSKLLAWFMVLLQWGHFWSYIDIFDQYINIYLTGSNISYEKNAKQRNRDENMWKQHNLNRFKHVTSKSC